MKKRGFVIGDRILSQSTDTHPDWCAGFGRLGRYSALGSSAVGRMHVRNVVPRDDAFAVRSSGPWLAAAVSDGVGSRPRSRYGASYAVDMLCAQLLHSVAAVEPHEEAPRPATPSPSVAQTRTEAQFEVLDLKGGESGVSSSEDESLKRENTVVSQGKAPPLSAGAVADQGKGPDACTSARRVPPEFAPHELASGAFGTMSWYRPLESAIRVLGLDEPGPTDLASADLPGVALEEVMSRAFRNTRAGLEQFAQLQGVPLRELHCTLLGLLLNVVTGAVAVGHIGDGLVLGLHREKGAIPLVEAPVPGEVGATYLLTQVDWEKHFVTCIIPPEQGERITMFYLMTDGVADDCQYGPPEDILQRWAADIDREIRRGLSLSETAQRLLWFLASYQAKGSYDDRTLVVVFRDMD